MKKLAVVLALCFVGTAFAADKAAAPAATAAPAASPAAMMTPAAAMMSMETKVITPAKADWHSIGDPKKGPWVAAVQGDSSKEAFTAYLKLSAGGDSGWHTHNADYSGVVIEGAPTHQDQGGKEVKMSAGQSWTSKAGVNHRNTCTGKKDCIIFMAVRGPMSFNPMTAEGKAMEMPGMKTN